MNLLSQLVLTCQNQFKLKHQKEHIDINDIKPFLNLIKYKITGTARYRVIDLQFHSITHLISEIKSAFTSKLTLPLLQSEVLNVTQENTDPVLNFGLRVNKLLNQIKVIFQSMTSTAIECFIDGCKNDRLFLCTEGLKDLDSAMKVAMKLETKESRHKEKHGKIKPKTGISANKK